MKKLIEKDNLEISYEIKTGLYGDGSQYQDINVLSIKVYSPELDRWIDVSDKQSEFEKQVTHLIERDLGF